VGQENSVNFEPFLLDFKVQNAKYVHRKLIL